MGRMVSSSRPSQRRYPTRRVLRYRRFSPEAATAITAMRRADSLLSRHLGAAHPPHKQGERGRQIPWYQGISREFSPIVSVWWFFQLDLACLSSGLRANSLELRAGNFSTRSREFFAWSREKQGERGRGPLNANPAGGSLPPEQVRSRGRCS